MPWFPLLFLPSCRHLCRVLCWIFCRFFCRLFGDFSWRRLFCRLFVDFFGDFFVDLFGDFFPAFLRSCLPPFCGLFNKDFCGVLRSVCRFEWVSSVSSEASQNGHLYHSYCIRSQLTWTRESVGFQNIYPHCKWTLVDVMTLSKAIFV